MTHTLDDIATGCSVSLRTVQQWIEDGELVAVNLSRDRNSKKPRLRVLDSDLQAFLASRAVGPDGANAKPRERRRKRKPQKRYV